MNERSRRQLEELYAEQCWRRAKNDPDYFMRELVWVASQRDGVDMGRELFDLFDYQEEDLQAFLEHRFAIVLKARQLGLSTLVAGYALWLTLFRPGSVVVWVSNNQENANKAIGMLDTAWQFLPEWAKARAPRKEGDAATEKVWVHKDGMRSRIKARAGTKTAAVGETATLVVLDEFGLVDAPVQDDLYRSAGPTTDAGGSLFIISTARGRRNRFARMYLQAKAGKNRYHPIFHPWFLSRFVNPLAHLVRTCTACGGSPYTPDEDGGTYCTACVDNSVYEAKKSEFEDEPHLHRAEYPATEEQAFRESGRPRFPWLPDHDLCPPFPHQGRIEADPNGNPIFIEDPTGPLFFTEEARDPLQAHQYVVAVDPATGTGGDYTAMTCGYLDEEANPVRLAFWHANTIEPLEAARDAALLGKWFTGKGGAAKLVVEKQGGYGDSTINELRRLRYPNLYRHIYTDSRRRRRQDTYGLPMQWKRRPLVIDRLAEHLRPLDETRTESRMAGIDPLLLGELEAFVKTDDGKVQADVGCHDDLVMSAAIWLWVLVEDTTPATGIPCSEEPISDGSTYDLSYLFEEAEAVRHQEALQMRRVNRAWRSADPRRTVTLGGRRR